MPRRTGIDTILDSSNVPTSQELIDMANEGVNPAGDTLFDQGNIDPEDEALLTEGAPGEFGSGHDDSLIGNFEPMDDEDYETAVSKGIEAAENYIDMELSPDREQAARYYRGEKFGNEEEGRSAVVMTEVRDTVLAIMPPLLRMFCGTRHAVEFVNNDGTPEGQAKQQTAYVNHVIHKDNSGFSIFYSAFKDALVRKTGIFTWWYEEKETVSAEVLTGLNEDAFALLQMEKKEASSEDENYSYKIEILRQVPDTTAPDQASVDLLDPSAMGSPEMQAANPGEPQAPVQNFIRDVRVHKVRLVKRNRVAAVPPEEFICTPTTTDNLDEFPLVGRRQMKTIGELVAIGHNEDEIREAIGGQGSQSAVSLNTNAEAIDRNPAANLERLFDNGFAEVDPASEYVKYCEIYILIDRDGDGITERRKVCTVGNDNKIIYDDIVDEMVPFALICPDPEPHSPFGYSLADQTMDLQEIKSEMVRGILDSLAESIVSRMGIVDGGVNIDDALSNARGQLIRMKQQGNLQPLNTPFVGQNAMPVLAWLDDVKARRTGVTMAPAGLNADTLQSTATDAVQATVDASQERAEMIGRIFAETGMKRLMRGLLRQVVKHQDRKRTLRLMGTAVTVDPRDFNADLDLEVNVGLGRGTAAKRIGSLQFILGLQTTAIDKYGPNEMVNLHHVSNTLEMLIRENEFSDITKFMSPISAERGLQMVQAAQSAPKPPTPEELLYKANQEKLLADKANKSEAEQTKRVNKVIDDEFRRDQMQEDFMLRAGDLLGKYGIKLTEQELRAAMAHDDASTKMADDAIQGGQAAATQALAPPAPAQGGPAQQ